MRVRTTDSAVRYRRMMADDLPAAHKLSLSVLWPHRLEDWKFVHGLGEGIVAEDESGVIGTAMFWLYGQDYASAGMVTVAPERQNAGIGRAMMKHILREAGERNVLLHATTQHLPFCESLGFTRIGCVHQHQGSVFRTPFVLLGEGERIRPIGPRDEPAIAELSRRALGRSSTISLKHLMAVGSLVAIDRYGELIGYAALRKFGLGHVIGPVVAPDAERAKALIAHWAGSRAGSFVRLDVPDACGLSQWLTDMGLVQVDATVPVLVRGEAPRPDPSMTRFALLSQSLG